METEKKYYIVSFADSNQYAYVYDVPQDIIGKSEPFAAIEAKLNDFMRSKFPGQSFAYFTSARAVEVNPTNTKFASLPPLDDKAIKEIEAVLEREFDDMRSVERLNSNAQFADI